MQVYLTTREKYLNLVGMIICLFFGMICVLQERSGYGKTITTVKARKKQLFICKHEIFVKEIRLSKRCYKHEDKELLETQHQYQREFWRKIGRTGAGQNKQNDIPLNVKLEDGSVKDDIPTVLNRWKSDFSNLLNPVSEVSGAKRPFNVSGYNQNPVILNDTNCNFCKNMWFGDETWTFGFNFIYSF